MPRQNSRLLRVQSAAWGGGWQKLKPSARLSESNG